jgi:NADH-quinone oxidoreductase subunit B
MSNPSFRYICVGISCCGDDFLQTTSSRYDLDRLGCVPAESRSETNLVIIQGSLNEKLLNEVLHLKQEIQPNAAWMAVGTCICGGGLFPQGSLSQGQDEITIDVFVTGCPPRPEAIMNGVLLLQKRGIQNES